MRAGCSGSTCNYQISYGNGSILSRNLATDKLTLTSTDVVRNFLFGCGKINFGLFGKVAGLLGLARDGLSIVGQTASKYSRYFSYCLPSSSSSTGSSLFYGINIVEIAVARTKLQIPSTVFSKADAIIDSGTVITRLPPTAYNAMRTAFRKEMASYNRGKSFEILDTCYDLHDAVRPVEDEDGGSTL
ncbi:hypothetical protein NL676_019709 [Syzygium grande]|nr:hypothetical protein NL676_019709 [Syzygium grande]